MGVGDPGDVRSEDSKENQNGHRRNLGFVNPLNDPVSDGPDGEKTGWDENGARHRVLHRTNSLWRLIELAGEADQKEGKAKVQLSRGASLEWEENPRRLNLKKMIDAPRFNIAIAFFICLNTFIMGVDLDMQQAARADDQMLWYVKYPQPPEWFFPLCEAVFTLIFTAEFALRFYVDRKALFKQTWTYVDILALLPALLELILQSETELGNLMILRVMRLLKLCRFLRLIRICKELHVLASSFLAALRTLLWVALLLFIVLYCASVFCTILVGQNPKFNMDNDAMLEYAEKYDLPFYRDRYFGSIMRSVLTLFQIFTLDNWTFIVRPIVETHLPFMFPFFVSFIFLTTFGLLNLLVGVVVDHTVNAAKQIDLEREKLLKEGSHRIAFAASQLFKFIDEDGNGNLSPEEISDFMASAASETFRDSLPFSFDVDEFAEICQVIADDWLDPSNGSNDGLDIHEFVGAAMRLTGSAQSRDVVAGRITMKGIQANVDSLQQTVESLAAGQSALTTKVDQILSRLDSGELKPSTRASASIEKPPFEDKNNTMHGERRASLNRNTDRKRFSSSSSSGLLGDRNRLRSRGSDALKIVDEVKKAHEPPSGKSKGGSNEQSAAQSSSGTPKAETPRTPGSGAQTPGERVQGSGEGTPKHRGQQDSKDRLRRQCSTSTCSTQKSRDISSDEKTKTQELSVLEKLEVESANPNAFRSPAAERKPTPQRSDGAEGEKERSAETSSNKNRDAFASQDSKTSNSSSVKRDSFRQFFFAGQAQAASSTDSNSHVKSDAGLTSNAPTATAPTATAHSHSLQSHPAATESLTEPVSPALVIHRLVPECLDETRPTDQNMQGISKGQTRSHQNDSEPQSNPCYPESQTVIDGGNAQERSACSTEIMLPGHSPDSGSGAAREGQSPAKDTLKDTMEMLPGQFPDPESGPARRDPEASLVAHQKPAKPPDPEPDTARRGPEAIVDPVARASAVSGECPESESSAPGRGASNEKPSEAQTPAFNQSLDREPTGSSSSMAQASSTALGAGASNESPSEVQKKPARGRSCDKGPTGSSSKAQASSEVRINALASKNLLQMGPSPLPAASVETIATHKKMGPSPLPAASDEAMATYNAAQEYARAQYHQWVAAQRAQHVQSGPQQSNGAPSAGYYWNGSMWYPSWNGAGGPSSDVMVAATSQHPRMRGGGDVVNPGQLRGQGEMAVGQTERSLPTATAPKYSWGNGSPHESV